MTSILHEIHILKRENFSPKALKESIPKLGSFDDPSMSETEKEKIIKRDLKNRELAFAYRRYEEELARLKYYDFDDMLLELVRALEKDHNFKLILQENYQYILADEHQDANMAQNRILELLADFHDSPNLFIVGDDKQAIYRFQGASLDNFLYFTKKYESAVVIDLEHNYRSHQGILDASHSLIENNPVIPGRERTKLLSLQMGSNPISVHECASKDDELMHVADQIEELLKEGEKEEEIAVLYRENKEAKAIAQVLGVRGVKHRIESDHDILGAVDSIKLIILSRAIHNPSDSENLAKAFLLPELGLDTGCVMEVCSAARREKIELYEAIKDSKSDAGRQVKTAYSRILGWSKEAQTVSCTDFIQKLIQETGMMVSIAEAPDSLERLGALHAFYDKIIEAAKSKRTFFLADFISYLDAISEHGLLARRGYMDHVGGVRLMTAHRSKGLEFNHVFIINAVDGVWGNRSKKNKWNIPIIEHARDVGRLEDERRLFYVAMTRARESIQISYSTSIEGSQALPSQFLTEIDPSLVIVKKIEPEHAHSGFSKVLSKPKSNTSISILNAEFVKSRFASSAFSVTHLNNFLKCPWTYFFVNLIKIPQAPSKHQMYGTAVHRALKTYFDLYKSERDMSKKKFLEVLKHNIESEPLSQDDRRDSIERGGESLGGYISEYEGTWNRNLLTEVAVKGGEIVISCKDGPVRIELTGKLDKVEILNGSKVAVVDYKTSKPKSRNEIEGQTKDADGNYKRQLVFYKLLLDSAKKFDMEYGIIDFVEPNARGKYKREQFMIKGEEVVELKKSIEAVCHSILDLSFVDSTCKEKACEYCRLGKVLLASASSKLLQ